MRDSTDRAMRIIVTGGRDYTNAEHITSVLIAFPPGTVVVHGDNRNGADALGKRSAMSLGFPTEPHPADWTAPCRDTCTPGHRRVRPDGSDYCPMAGHYRNQEMADAGADLCIAFPGGRGTADMARRAEAAGIPVRHET